MVGLIKIIDSILHQDGVWRTPSNFPYFDVEWPKFSYLPARVSTNFAQFSKKFRNGSFPGLISTYLIPPGLFTHVTRNTNYKSIHISVILYSKTRSVQIGGQVVQIVSGPEPQQGCFLSRGLA